MPIKPKGGETEQEFISRCIPVEIEAGKETDVAAAICYSIYREEKMNKSTTNRVADKIAKLSNNYKGVNLSSTGEVNMEEPCWENYIQIGTKIVDGKEVPDCRGPIEE